MVISDEPGVENCSQLGDGGDILKAPIDVHVLVAP
jgi:hypothetical protein